MLLKDYFEGLKKDLWYAGQIPLVIYTKDERTIDSKEKPADFIFQVEKNYPKILKREILKAKFFWNDLTYSEVKEIRIWIK